MIELIAKACHEVNKAYCESIGDKSQPSWEDAPEWQKESAIVGVQFHLSGDRSPEDSHQSWSEQKVADGWVYGEVKDPVAKTHPCLVPYYQLPLEQRTKDYLFKSVVDSFKVDSTVADNRIENAFTYHPPKEGQPQLYNIIRDNAKNFAITIDNIAPDSREKSIALTKLEEAVFWTNAAIARN